MVLWPIRARVLFELFYNIRFAYHSLQSSVRIVVSYRYNHKKKSDETSFFLSPGEPLSAAARFSSASMLSSLPTEIPIHINSLKTHDL